MYRIIGADGQEYGPVGTEELRRWIAEGRANALSRVRVGEAGEWRQLGDLPEFSSILKPQPSEAALPSKFGRLNPAALGGLILSGLGFCCCIIGLPASIAGIVFSCVGLSRIGRTPGQTGRGLAIAGIILGIVGIFTSAGALIVLLLNLMAGYN